MPGGCEETPLVMALTKKAAAGVESCIATEFAAVLVEQANSQQKQQWA